jgi:hypothetical protein
MVTISQVIFGSLCVAAQIEFPAVYVDRIDRVPDLLQTAVQDEALNGGDSLCAPVAVSNSLLDLALNGYPNLVEDVEPAESRQIALVRTLASPGYMHTDPGSGTSKERVTSGTEAYVRSRGYEVGSLEYRGIEIHFQPGKPVPSTRPDLDWLKSRLSAGASVWLQIGWYRKDGDDFRKTGGHWVTLTGYGADSEGKEDAMVLILRDPSPRAGPGPSSEFVKTERLGGGRIFGWGLPQPAGGFYELTLGLSRPAEANTALLEGAVVLELEAP